MPDPDEMQITRRKLPHWELEGSTYFVTFRLIEGILSKKEQIILLDHLKNGDGKFYMLIAATIMPEHAHIILKPEKGFTLSRILEGVKGVSARLINQRRNTGGSLWKQESWDRIIRDEEELLDILNYMYMNPIKKGLADDPESWHAWYINYGDYINA